MQDPATFLVQLGIDVPCAMLPDSTARLQSDCLTRLNWEVYYFSSTAQKARFDANPTAWCGMVTDPIAKTRFKPDEDSPRAAYQGTTYYFMSVDNRSEFEKHPVDFAWPSYPMTKMSTSR